MHYFPYSMIYCAKNPRVFPLFRPDFFSCHVPLCKASYTLLSCIISEDPVGIHFSCGTIYGQSNCRTNWMFCCWHEVLFQLDVSHGLKILDSGATVSKPIIKESSSQTANGKFLAPPPALAPAGEISTNTSSWAHWCSGLVLQEFEQTLAISLIHGSNVHLCGLD